ncbi:MAG TPA: hypothetical protein DHN29_08415 [Cytophagales bacterium]|nr:hypothetical protein [Cytophagales bacterium]
MSVLELILDAKEDEEGGDIFIIAELANAHQGDPTTAQLLVTSAANGGADAVKFQIYFANELFSPSHSEYTKFKNREWSFDVWKSLVVYARESGLQVGADVFGNNSLNLAFSLDIDFLKIHSSDVSKYSLIQQIAQTSCPLLLSAGGTTMLELTEAIEAVEDIQRSRVCMMFGYQGFPTEIDDLHILRMNTIQRTFGIHVGLADHIDADLDMAIHLPLIALGQGCRIFEKHITYNRSAKGTDYYSSLEPKEFQQFVNQLRSGLVALGSKEITMGEAENNYRSRMKKHVTAGESLKSGTILTDDKLRLARIENHELSPLPMSSWIGKKLLRSVKKNHVFRYEDIEQSAGLCIVARLHSSRLPNKALADIVGKPSLGHLFERAQIVEHVSKPVLCTTTNPEDDELVKLAFSYGIDVIRGDSKNVLSRLISAINEFGFDIVLRVTGDDILLDPLHVESLINYLRRHNLDYVSAKDLPGGTEAEAFTASALKTIERYAKDPDYTEYLTYYVDDPSFACGKLPIEEKYRRAYSLSLDTQEDLHLVRRILESIYDDEKPYTLEQVIKYMDENPSLSSPFTAGREERRNIKDKTKLNFGLA